MKNRYCLFCGTLLPEDGVCLRCGAKYELADNGQMKVIPRKVKKVSAKKKVTGKKQILLKPKHRPSLFQKISSRFLMIQNTRRDIRIGLVIRGKNTSTILYYTMSHLSGRI